MERRKRRTYMAEFKRDIINLITMKGRKATEVAKNFDIQVELVYRWLQNSWENGSKQSKEINAQAEIKRLQRRLADVEEERDILKKAMTIFTHPSKQDFSS